MLDTSRIKFGVDLPETAMPLLPYAKEIWVTFQAAPGNKLPATIQDVSHEASRSTRTYRVTVLMDQPAGVRILPGMSGELRARLEPPNTQPKALEVLASALFEESDGATCVWLVDTSTMTVHRQPVKTLRPTTVGFLVEGLKAGQTVVTAGVHYLKEGQKVRINESPDEVARPVRPNERFGSGSYAMSLTAAAVKRRTFTLFATFILILAGIASYFTLGQLEDPEFTIKNAVVVTAYPGASPEEVELEVTDRLELAIQQMPQVKYVSSFSRQGLSQINVAIQPQYRSNQLPQVWNELRRKVGDTRRQFPPGVGEPKVVDDFGDVYGFLLGVVADGFSYADLERYVDGLRKELSLVKGVARVEVWGVQPECIYLDASQSRLANAGVSVDQIRNTVQQQNLVVDAGAIDVANQRMQVSTTGMFRTPEDIADLSIRGGPIGKTEPAGLVRLGDIAGSVGVINSPRWRLCAWMAVRPLG